MLRERLEKQVKTEWEEVRAAGKKEIEGKPKGSFWLGKALEDDGVEVSVSERDRDPYGVLIAKRELGGYA